MTLLSKRSLPSSPTSPNLSTRPGTHAQRDVCIAFASTLAARVADGLHPTIDATWVSLRARSDAYLAAREANAAAAARVARDSDRVAGAKAALVDALHAWMMAVDQQRGRSGACVAELPPLLGNRSLSAFLKTSPRSQITHLRTLVVHAAGTPDLVGSPVALAGLRTATEGLAGAVDAQEADRRAHVVTRADAARASRDFDRVYGLLVRELRYASFEVVVPQFTVLARGRRADGAALPASTPSAPVLTVVPGIHDTDVDTAADADAGVDSDADVDVIGVDEVDVPDDAPAPAAARSGAA